MSSDVLAVNISVYNKLFLTENFIIKDSQYKSKFTIICIYTLLFVDLSFLFIGCLITSFFGWGVSVAYYITALYCTKISVDIQLSLIFGPTPLTNLGQPLHNLKILPELWSVEFGYFCVFAKFNFAVLKFISFIVTIFCNF